MSRVMKVQRSNCKIQGDFPNLFQGEDKWSLVDTQIDESWEVGLRSESHGSCLFVQELCKE